MAALTVWRFPHPANAEQALEALQDLEKQQLLTLHDGAVVSWQPGAKKPSTRQLHSTAGVGALGGTFWGLLFGMIFFVPLLGAALGAATGALAGSLTDAGISDEFVKDVKEKVTPGTSALFILTSDAVL